MPSWTPYSAGLAFARANSNWIAERLDTKKQRIISDGDGIGKHHHVRVFGSADATVKTRVDQNNINLTTSLPIEDSEVQTRLRKACERALKQEAESLLPERLAELAQRHDYQFASLKIKKLTSRWGSCSERDDISLSFYLIQQPWELIDYVLLHELVHTVHKHHQTGFWAELERVCPGAKQLRKQLRQNHPRLEPSESR
jgi:predicted metal-dependent hydrolase